MSRLWDVGGAVDEEILHFTTADDPILDRRLVPHDIRGSAAHVRMLWRQGLISREVHEALQAALEDLRWAWERGEWDILPEEEDGHTALENRLVERVGDAGRAVHLGRSRNDQVLTALRLWLKDRLEETATAAEGVADSLDGIARAQGHLPIPGYTHLQRAMPSTVALWAGGFAAEVRDDAEGLRRAIRRADRNPLGSGAGYGIPLPLDREMTARELGFSEVHDPVTAVQISRGKAEASALFEGALLARDLARLAADLSLFATQEFGFVRLAPEITTGSSLMPQKRNPDIFELVRGRSGEAFAALQEVLVVASQLPSGYHRDLQQMKRPLFRGMDGVLGSARVMARALRGVTFLEERLREASADPDLQATARACERALREGIPFREAYRQVKTETLKG